MKKRVLISLIGLLLLSYVPFMAQNLKGNWTWIGPKKVPEQTMGLVAAMWVDTANLNFVLAGSAAGGLWKCDNAQSELPKWKNISDSYDSICTGIFGIAVKPGTQNRTIYIGTKTATKDIIKPYGIGILKTDNAGKSWTKVGPQKNIVIDCIKMCPDNPMVMIATSGKELFITKDEWKSFKTISLPTENADPWYQTADIEFAPYSDKIVYIGTRSDKNKMADLFVTKDLGESFENISHGLRSERYEIAVIRNQKFKDKFYIAYGYALASIQFFDGKKWSDNLNAVPMQHTAGGPYWTFDFAVNEVDTNVMYLAMTEVSKSTDGGRTFDRVAYYNSHNTHADIRDFFLAKSTIGGKKDILFLANDGGISQSNEGVNDFEKWKSVNGYGLGITQFWGMDVWQSDTMFIAAGAQDNSMFWLRDTVWHNNFLVCGDGYDAAVITRNTFLIECNVPQILQNNTATRSIWALALPDNYAKGGVRPLKCINGKVYLGHRNLYEFDALKIEDNDYKVKNKTNLDEIYDKEGTILNSSISAFDICAGNRNVACVAYINPIFQHAENKGKLFITRNFLNASPAWEDVSKYAICNTLEICQWSEIYDLVIDDQNDNLIYLISRDVFDQTNCKIFFMEYKANSGIWEVTEKTFDLPKAGFNKILKEKDSDNLYLATDFGVYYTNSELLSQNRWEKFNGDSKKMPACVVTDLVINYANNKLYCSTYARGIWEGSLASNLGYKFTYNKTTVVDEPLRVDGKLIVAANSTLELNSKIFISKGSVIELKKGAKLILKKDNVFSYEGQKIDLKGCLKLNSTAKLVYK